MNKLNENEFIDSSLISSEHNCEAFKSPYIIVEASLTMVSLTFLHHKFSTPFVKMTVGESNI